MKKRILITLIGISLMNVVIEQNSTETKSKLNIELIETLDSIRKDDQKHRGKIEYIQEKYGNQSIELDVLWDTIDKKDSINQVKVKAILEKYGWLGEDTIGAKGSKTLFLVIQHGDIEFKLKYLPLLREAVRNGKAKGKDLALLEDRVLMMQGKKQIFGSQIGFNPETGDYFISPVEDPDNVDKRRAEVGLKPMAEYVSIWNLTWNVEEHKNNTDDLENKN